MGEAVSTEFNILKSFKHAREKVRYIMNEFPDTRNNDNLLIVTYWKLVDEVEDLDGVVFATPPEVIRRARQLLNERGILLATDAEVLKRRRQHGRIVKKGITKL